MPKLLITRSRSRAGVRSHEREQSITVNLYRATREPRKPDNMCDGLRALGFMTPSMRRNPTISEWVMLISSLSKLVGTGAVTTLVCLLKEWVKQRKGRRIEIEAPGLKVKTSTVAELENVLAALDKHTNLVITLNGTRHLRLTAKTKPMNEGRGTV